MTDESSFEDETVSHERAALLGVAGPPTGQDQAMSDPNQPAEQPDPNETPDQREEREKREREGQSPQQ